MGMTTAQRTAWLESQYNNRARVPEHAQILSRWAADSAAVRQRSRCEIDLAYGDGAGERLDVFMPDAPQANAPVLVFIHGGWWRALDKSDHSFVAPAYTAEGALVLVPNYALCPEVTIEHIALQMARAVAWAWHHGPRFGGDRRRIVVAGHSAGGHLAALMLTCRWPQLDPALPPDVVRAGVAISGVFDLGPLRRTPFLQQDLRLTPASVRRLSPVHLPPPRVPLAALAGADESAEFMRQLALIRRAWGSAAVPVAEPIVATNHFTVLDDFARPGTRLQGLVLQWLRQAGQARLSRGQA